MQELIVLPLLLFIAFTDMGNDNFDWAQVQPIDCVTGESKSGHAVTFNNKIYFKQKNYDGTIGKVCDRS